MLLRSALPSDSGFEQLFEELYDPALVIDPATGQILVGVGVGVGADADGNPYLRFRRELLAIEDGYRESTPALQGLLALSLSGIG